MIKPGQPKQDTPTLTATTISAKAQWIDFPLMPNRFQARVSVEFYHRWSRKLNRRSHLINKMDYNEY